MRSWTAPLVALFLFALLAPSALADQCDEGQSDCSPANGQQGGSDATPNEAGNQTDGEGAPQSTAQSQKDARAEERERRKAEGWAAYRDSDPRRTSAEAEHQELRAQVAADIRQALGHLTEQDGQVTGTYVTFGVDRQLGTLQDISGNGVLLFETIHTPVGLGGTATTRTAGNSYEVTGEDWSMRLIDHAAPVVRLDAANDDPFLLAFPIDSDVQDVPYGLRITYPSGTVAHLRGDVERDPVEPETVLVSGKATYYASHERTLLPQVSNQVLPAVEDAIIEGRFGAEVTVLRAADALYEDVLLYEDMQLELDQEARAEAGEASYLITVDSASHVGKTISVAFQSGLLDPQNLVFQYYNVEEDVTTEASIRQAASLADVLDPLDDGTIAEYWVVEDADGVQVLVSIPNFSIHQIRLSSVFEVLAERPSLVVGTVGAAVVVTMATIGMFRRPEDL